MKFKILLPSLLLGVSAWATTPSPKPAQPKIPHSHHSQHGGLVLMFGDDHLEVVRDSKGAVLVFLSDKFREPLQAKDFDLDFSVVEGSPTPQPLTFEASKKPPYALTLNLPASISRLGIVQFKALRKSPPRGYVVSDKMRIALMDELPVMKLMDHSSHR